VTLHAGYCVRTMSVAESSQMWLLSVAILRETVKTLAVALASGPRDEVLARLGIYESLTGNLLSCPTIHAPSRPPAAPHSTQ